MRADPLYPTAVFLPLCHPTRARAAARGTSCGGWADDDLTGYITDDELLNDERGGA
jgi:hypothetical protein